MFYKSESVVSDAPERGSNDGEGLVGIDPPAMFNTDTICMECAEAERRRPDYEAACAAEEAAVRAGDRNFKGVGL